MSTPKTEIMAPPGRQEITVVREFNAPCDLVYLAHTDPKYLARWFGCRDMTTVIERFEAKTGGSFRYSQCMPQFESAFTSYGVFHEVRSCERIVKTLEFDGNPGHVVLETTRFQELRNGRTRVTVHSVFQSLADRDEMIERGVEKGTGESFERLDEILMELCSA